MDFTDNRQDEAPKEASKGGGESLPTPTPLVNEKGESVVDVEALLRSCSIRGLQSNVAERIRQADVDQDGALSVDELVEVMRRELQAVSDRKLFRNILISMFVAVLVLVATLCGTVYAIVSLSKEVKNDNGLLVSSSSGDVMATGVAQETVKVGPELLGLLNIPEKLSEAHSIIIPSLDNSKYTLYKVAKITSSPSTGTMEVNTIDGTTLLMNQSGVYEASGDNDNRYLSLLVSGDSRRSLLSDSSEIPKTEGASMVLNIRSTRFTSSSGSCDIIDRRVEWCSSAYNKPEYTDRGRKFCMCSMYRTYWSVCELEPPADLDCSVYGYNFSNYPR